VPELAVTCHRCGRAHRFEDVLPRRADCDGCGLALKCCRNCTFYDPSAYNECREPVAERVVDKEAANFCDCFRPRAGGAAVEGPAAGGRDALERLFKKS
jgi:hypothetical protein